MISQRELEILGILAKSKEAMTSSQIVFAGDWLSQSTVQTVLRKLLKSGLVEVDNVVHSGNVLSRTYKVTAKCSEVMLQEFVEFYEKIQNMVPKDVVIEALKDK